MNTTIDEAIQYLETHNHKVIPNTARDWEVFIPRTDGSTIMDARELIHTAKRLKERLDSDKHDFDKKRTHLKLQDEKLGD